MLCAFLLSQFCLRARAPSALFACAAAPKPLRARKRDPACGKPPHQHQMPRLKPKARTTPAPGQKGVEKAGLALLCGEHALEAKKRTKRHAARSAQTTPPKNGLPVALCALCSVFACVSELLSIARLFTRKTHIRMIETRERPKGEGEEAALRTSAELSDRSKILYTAPFSLNFHFALQPLLDVQSHSQEHCFAPLFDSSRLLLNDVMFSLAVPISFHAFLHVTDITTELTRDSMPITENTERNRSENVRPPVPSLLPPPPYCASTATPLPFADCWMVLQILGAATALVFVVAATAAELASSGIRVERSAPITSASSAMRTYMPFSICRKYAARGRCRRLR